MRRVVFIIAYLFVVLIALAAPIIGWVAAEGERASPEFNWALQGKDPASDGCPEQYPQYTELDGHIYLIGCWGERK